MKNIRAATDASKPFIVTICYGWYVSFGAHEISQGKVMNHFLKWQDHVGSQPEKFYKTTLWQGDHAMVGLNCLEPGQTQKVHAHDGADKFYLVLEGSGIFTVGDEE